MIAQRPTHEETLAELNDLLQLDHDAIEAYTIAIDQLQEMKLKQALLAFRADHERHVVALTQLIRGMSGTPAQGPHMTTGALKSVVQQMAGLGGTREILLAFKANERQVLDKYRRAAARALTPAIDEVLDANLADEERHYQWVVDALTSIGVAPDSTTAKVQGAFESAQALMTDVLEMAERRAHS